MDSLKVSGTYEPASIITQQHPSSFVDENRFKYDGRVIYDPG